MKKISRIYKNDFQYIESFLKNSFSSPTHWPDWNLLISKEYNSDFFYFACYEDNNLIGVIPVHSVKKGLVYKLMSGPRLFYMPYGGWIFNKKVNIEECFIDIQKNESLEIFSLPVLNEFNAGYDNYQLLKLYETNIIDLKKSEDEIWNGFSSQKRYKIRKAKRNGIQIEEINDITFSSFYNFYEKTNIRYGLENITEKFFNELIINSKNIRVDFLTAKSENEIIGSVILLSDKDFSFYWIGTRVEKAPNTGYFDLLHWEMIKKAKSFGCKYYDTCYLEKERLPNIYRFKIGFSDNVVPVFNVIEKPGLFRVINKIQKHIL